jgi:hypothetical protein
MRPIFLYLSHKKMIKRIERIARKALKQPQASLDCRWYELAGGWCNGLDADFSLEPGTSAGFVAALSPLNSWDSQLAYTPPSIAACLELIRAGRRCHEGIRGPGFFSNRDKAARILQGESPLDVLGGDKVRAFYLNLTGDYSVVTIDRHALSICGWQGSLTSRAYSRISCAYKFAGERFDLTGPELQALTWNYWRRNHAAYAAGVRRKEGIE